MEEIGLNVLAQLPAGTLSAFERDRFERFPLERRYLVSLAMRRRLDFVNDVRRIEGMPLQGLCEKCGRVFELSRSDQRYCADDCKNAANQAAFRGRESKPLEGSTGGDASTPRKAYGSEAVTSTSSTLSGPRVTCEYCTKEFRAKRSTAKYCSTRCKRRHQRYRTPQVTSPTATFTPEDVHEVCKERDR